MLIPTDLRWWCPSRWLGEFGASEKERRAGPPKLSTDTPCWKLSLQQLSVGGGGAGTGSWVVEIPWAMIPVLCCFGARGGWECDPLLLSQSGTFHSLDLITQEMTHPKLKELLCLGRNMCLGSIFSVALAVIPSLMSSFFSHAPRPLPPLSLK